MDNKKGDLNILIKCSCLGNAAGIFGCAYIASVPDMPEDSFFALPVVGLTCSSVAGESSFLYLCHSRAGCAAMWEHWFLNVAIPLIAKSAAGNSGMRDPNGDNWRNLFSLDGEAIILQQAFSPAVLAALKAAGIDVAKLSPSSTSFSQAWDCGTMFR